MTCPDAEITAGRWLGQVPGRADIPAACLGQLERLAKIAEYNNMGLFARDPAAQRSADLVCRSCAHLAWAMAGPFEGYSSAWPDRDDADLVACMCPPCLTQLADSLDEDEVTP